MYDGAIIFDQAKRAGIEFDDGGHRCASAESLYRKSSRTTEEVEERATHEIRLKSIK
jgi:hypothetical protein